MSLTFCLIPVNLLIFKESINFNKLTLEILENLYREKKAIYHRFKEKNKK